MTGRVLHRTQISRATRPPRRTAGAERFGGTFRRPDRAIGAARREAAREQWGFSCELRMDPRRRQACPECRPFPNTPFGINPLRHGSSGLGEHPAARDYAR